MADIELVIKLSEETYKDIQSHDWKNAERWFSEEWKAIHNGTPLPKGHGRLIDADVMWDSYHSNDYDFYEALDDAPTIIEAESEGENE